MFILAWANLTHRKVRSTLSVLAVAIAIMLFLVLVGLSHGTLNEVSRRMESVQAEIIVRDKHFDLGSMSGGKLWEKEIPLINAIEIDNQPAVRHVIPVFLGRLKLAGLSQNVFGIHPHDFTYFCGPRRLLHGSLFPDWAQSDPERMTADPLPHMPLIIDQRLARAADLHTDQLVDLGGSRARITGIVETGVAGRVFAPVNHLRSLHGVAAPTAHMFFVKAHPHLSTAQLQQLADRIEDLTHRHASLVANYHQVLSDNFRNIAVFVNLVSAIALVICFLFIIVTMYTMVLERAKEIAILQSLGAAKTLILRQTMQESLLICLLGTLLGIALSFTARYLVQTFQPLMTIDIKPAWLALAAVIGIVGGILSAVYPGYLALRRDPVLTLTYE